MSRRRLLAGAGTLLGGTVVGAVGASADDGPGSRDGGPTLARAPDGPSAQATGAASGVESVVDRHMADAVEDGDVVGGAAAVVRGDDVSLAKGYGRTRRGGDAVDADTPFRLGSVSKPVVWTAVMQLIESGRIDPHADVRTALDSVSMGDQYDEPTTTAHLATHTAGFEARNQGLWVSDPADRRPLARVLNEEAPARVRPPGETAAYSNYGAALAGQLVADVASRPLAEHLRDRVFEPLGMSTATFEQPPPAATPDGYTAALGSPAPAPELTAELWPAGALTASATDMGRFVRAHLTDGSVDGGRVLSAEEIERMRDRWFGHHPTVDGVGFGWIRDTHGDVRTLWHNGAIPGSFYSHVLLVPEADLGLFLAYNTDVGATAASDLIDDALAAAAPRSDPPERTPSGQPRRADALGGTYRGLRVARTTHSRLFTTVQAGEISVTVDDEGYLVTDAGGETTRWVEREPLVFDEADGHETLAFEANDGEITHQYLGWQAFRRLSWSESLSLHGGLGVGSAVGMLSGGLSWPALAGWRRLRRGGETEGDSDDPDEADDAHANATGTGSDGPGEAVASASQREPDRSRTTDVAAGERARSDDEGVDGRSRPAEGRADPSDGRSTDRPEDHPEDHPSRREGVLSAFASPGVAR